MFREGPPPSGPFLFRLFWGEPWLPVSGTTGMTPLAHTRTCLRSLLAAAAIPLMIAAGGAEVAREGAAEVSYVQKGDSLPRIRFADGLVSLNDRCPVRKAKLNLKMPPRRIWINLV